ncbi:MAG: hypothetical protein ACTS5G_02590 [Burkholderiales bacterium]
MGNPIRLALAVVSLAIVAGASAQDGAGGRFGQAAACLRENASRLPADLDCGARPTDEVVISHEIEITTTLTTPEIVFTDCQAAIALEYSQRGAIARVQGEINNETCPASSGTFVVSIRTAADDGETLTTEYPETWQRSDAGTVSFSADYDIGENVELVRVRTLRSRCKCTAAE